MGWGHLEDGVSLCVTARDWFSSLTTNVMVTIGKERVIGKPGFVLSQSVATIRGNIYAKILGPALEIAEEPIFLMHFVFLGTHNLYSLVQDRQNVLDFFMANLV